MWVAQSVSLWGEELNVLYMMNRLALNSQERLVEEQKTEAIGTEFKKFAKNTIHFLKPRLTPFLNAAEITEADWFQLPLARVARLLESDKSLHFWLPEDGALLEVGVLAIGEKAQQPELAQLLVNELISTNQALATHNQLQTGVVHRSLSGIPSIEAMQKPEALREFALNRLRFPDLSVDDIPSFQRVFDETAAATE